MANFCSHHVWFEGSPENILLLTELINQLMEKQALTTRSGILPDFVDDSEGGWMFDIRFDDNCFEYLCKHGPNTTQIVEIAKKFGLVFTMEFEEFGNHIYGKAEFTGTQLITRYVPEEDVNQLNERYDQENSTYHFRGEDYETIYDPLDILLLEVPISITEIK